MYRIFVIIALVALALPITLGNAQATTPPLSGHGCADFDSQVWAQSVYDAAPADNAAMASGAGNLVCPDLPSGFAPALWTTAIPAGAEPATLRRVIDGDTIEVELGGQVETVRMILVDTPETKKPNSPIECFGAEATAFTTNVLTGYGGRIFLEKDVSERDRYGRLLRYVWLDLGDQWRVDGSDAAPAVYLVDEAIVRAGFGALVTFPPDVEYVDQIRAAQSFARDHQFGLWSACGGGHVPLTAQPAALTGPVSQPAAAPPVAPAAVPAGNCDPSYPDVCIPPPPPDLDCGDITARRFRVLPPDPHRFDGDHDGIGCESG
ncbi:MAG TPA: thermonuclease family protein [Thermomicrobiales bacterium]|nr:thermonuclease family protein [Thermomicrobiales bacterium]